MENFEKERKIENEKRRKLEKQKKEDTWKNINNEIFFQKSDGVKKKRKYRT